MVNTVMCQTVANTCNQKCSLSFRLLMGSLAWAERRGYKTAKAARNDVYRAANSLLRLAIDGRLCLCLRPPGYSCLRGKRSSSMTQHFGFKCIEKLKQQVKTFRGLCIVYRALGKSSRLAGYYGSSGKNDGGGRNRREGR